MARYQLSKERYEANRAHGEAWRNCLGPTVEQLRAAGYTNEADRLAQAVRRDAAWSLRPEERKSVKVLALSALGSRRYDELAQALDLATWS